MSKMQKDTAGFTLVEAIISMAILSMAMLVATLGFMTIVRLQAKAATANQVQQATRYLQETVARDVRNAVDYEVKIGGRQLVLSKRDELGRIRYTYVRNHGVYRVGCDEIGGANCNGQPRKGQNLTAGQVHVVDFEFEKLESGSTDPLRISMTTQGPNKDLQPEDPYYYEYTTTTTVVPRQ